MACPSTIYGEHLAVTVRLVSSTDEVAVENLVSGLMPFIQTLFPVYQVSATPGETLKSVLYRVYSAIHQPGEWPIGRGFKPNTVQYNGKNIDIYNRGDLAISEVMDDPRSTLLVINGDLTYVGCMCCNSCCVNCWVSEPVRPTITYINQILR
jgi:hypothetical protein